MERHALLVRVKPDKRERYLELHSAVWPQVEATLSDCNVTNYTIFSRDDVLVAYYEYVGPDHDADMLRVAADPITREWWTHTDPCQTAFFENLPEGDMWGEVSEIWHLA